MPYLLLVTIGPVQEFIAAARRTRDLWFGSWLLSELAKTVAHSLQAHGELIFPAPFSQDDLIQDSSFNCPNKILVHITTDNVKEVADDANKALCKRLHEISDVVFKKVKSDFNHPISQQQIDDLIEFMWVALPFPDGLDYAATRKKLEALMAARKNTRNFRPVQWGSNTPKSSIDGLRESVIPEDKYPKSNDKDAKQKNTEMIEKLYRNYGAGQGERLSGVDLLKRHGQRGNQSRFASTSHIAAQPLFKYLIDLDTATHLNGKVVESWNEYIRQLEGIPQAQEYINQERSPKSQAIFDDYDGSLLFVERFRDGLAGDDLTKAQKALRHFLLPFMGHREPIPYYAILHADGDSMGVVIDHQAQHGLLKHQEISGKLAKFAHDVRDIVEKHHGALVYAGGDDVLAFVPLHTVLDCARHLSICFKWLLRRFNGINSEGKPITPTLSVGVALVHHLEPLSDALNLARAAEAAAKSIVGKNALAITLSKRGGADRTIRGSWQQPFFRRLMRFAELHLNNQIPDGAAYELQDLALRFDLSQAPDDQAWRTWIEIRYKETLRILKRKRTNEKEVDPEIIKWLETIITGENIGEIANELIIASLFAQAKQLSEGSST